MYVRYGVRSAVTWRIVTEIMRRHQSTCRLRVLETHPGGGTYDCLSIGCSHGEIPFEVQLCDFNMGSQHLHPWHSYRPPLVRLDDLHWPDGNDYVQAFLAAEDPKTVVDQVEALLGLPAVGGPSPATKPSTLLLRVIAAVMERYAFARPVMDARCGWHDSSGYEGTYAEPWLSYFPDLDQRLRLLRLGGPWQEAASIAGRIWRLGLREKEEAVLLDLGSGRACRTGTLTNQVSLWELYVKSGRRLEPVVAWVMENLA